MNRDMPSVEIEVDDLELFSSDTLPAKVHMKMLWKKDFEEGDMPV